MLMVWKGRLVDSFSFKLSALNTLFGLWEEFRATDYPWFHGRSRITRNIFTSGRCSQPN